MPPQPTAPQLKPHHSSSGRDSGFTDSSSLSERESSQPFHMSRNHTVIQKADQAVHRVRQLSRIRSNEWKKVLKHKTGVTVEILQQEKTTVFKGEMMMRGFNPQAVFYIIGMRKLWDNQFDDGCLLENLNETTSITYESYRASGTTKASDITLVEKIDCSNDGEIVFAYSSIETNHMPKISGKTRQDIQLQGWVLQTIPTTPPSTQVTFITEETVRGWIPSLTKKSLARKPLIMIHVHDYLQSKARSSVPRLLAPPPDPQRPAQRSSSASVHTNHSSTSSLTMAPPARTSLIQPPPRRSSLNLLDSHNRLYPSPRHRSVRIDSMETYKRWLNSDLDDWKHQATLDGFDIYNRPCQSYEMPILRGQGIIQGPWSPEQICSAVQNFGSRRHWDDYFEEGQVVERFSQKEYLIYTKMRNVFPIQGRDFTMLSHIESDVKSGTIHVVSASVTDAMVPESKTHIRGEWLVYGWSFQAIKNKAGERIGVHITFINHMDLAGTTPLPSAIIRRLVTDVPSQVSRLQRYLQEYGHPPYVRRVAGKVVREHYDPQSQAYAITLIAKHSPAARRLNTSDQTDAHAAKQQQQWCTDIRVDPVHYPHGFQAVAHPEKHVLIVHRPNHSGIRIYTQDSSLDGATIRIDITALTSSPRSSDESTPCASPLPTGTEFLSRSPPTPSPSPPPQMSHDLKSVTSLSDTLTFSVHSASSIKTLSARKTIIAINNYPKPLEASTASISESTLTPHVPHAKPPSPSPINDVAPPPATRKPITGQGRQQNASSPIIVIGDQLTFNGQQLSVIFGLMVLCYYVGKFSCRCA
ncbi:Bet v1-like protein [Hesseltinella vesiculosa]|uniref:Bet v1-like protein n=1 Tax=Hesseltinella vesiculosa TaxID=101127 RepID=A0A1X2GR00_9FUNG|nr:Bet v1-like protein [Hesseltinella vesiculosa]